MLGGPEIEFPAIVTLPNSHPARAGVRDDLHQVTTEAERRLREAIDVLPEGIVFLDEAGRYVLWNQKYAEIYAKSADLFCEGARLADTLRIGVERGDYPEAIGCEEQWLEARLSLLDNPGVRHEQLLADGKWILIEERKTQGGGTIGLRVDITELKAREEAFRLLFEGNPVPLLVYDATTATISTANEAAMDYFGYAKAEFAGLAASRLFIADDWPAVREVLKTNCSQREQFWHQRSRDGTPLETVLFTRQTILSGKPVTIISVFDVTERRRVEARMVHMARHDELTGLANRTYCRELLCEYLVNRKKAEVISLALVDLDHFKAVNDSYGHLIGDMLLANAARRMLELIPARATLCRIGGDEFAIIFRNSSANQVDLVMKAIIAVMALAFSVGEHALHIGATVGISSSPGDSCDPETLMRYADLALYAAKSRQRGSSCHFAPAMDAVAQEKTRLENDLREAVHKSQLEVHYQPLINLMSEEIEGYEALLRWTHPELGEIPPDRFVPLAEEIGLIDILGQYVLRTACQEALEWPEHMTISVNVSPIQFRSGQLLNTVVHALAASGLPANRLELEITEAVLMEKGHHTASTIRSLRAMGVGIAMDDFGTGYSSLGYLLSYPFTKIKIDKSFVTGMQEHDNSFAIIRAVIALGKNLGMKVTAEGIETTRTRDILQAEGCAQGQGYLFGKAQAADTIVSPIDRRNCA